MGFPDADTLVERYARTMGVGADAIDFYRILATFKLAVVLEGIHYRFVHGQTVGAGFDRIGDLVGPLVATGLAALRADDPTG